MTSSTTPRLPASLQARTPTVLLLYVRPCCFGDMNLAPFLAFMTWTCRWQVLQLRARGSVWRRLRSGRCANQGARHDLRSNLSAALHPQACSNRLISSLYHVSVTSKLLACL
jgi:hypothetical protein